MSEGALPEWAETRSENFQAAMHGRGQSDIIEAAAKSDGRITGLKVTVIADIGGYYQYVSPLMAMLTGLMLPGPFRCGYTRCQHCSLFVAG